MLGQDGLVRSPSRLQNWYCPVNFCRDVEKMERKPQIVVA